jgi:hypothetical protein
VQAYFARQYGDGVLANPPKSGFTLILWALPVVAVIVGGLFLPATCVRCALRRLKWMRNLRKMWLKRPFLSPPNSSPKMIINRDSKKSYATGKTMSDIANRLEQPKKSSRSYLSIAVWVIVLGLLAVLGWGLVNSTAPRPEVGEMAPQI